MSAAEFRGAHHPDLEEPSRDHTGPPPRPAQLHVSDGAGATMTGDLPLSVWLTGQHPARSQRGDRYDTERLQRDALLIGAHT